MRDPAGWLCMVALLLCACGDRAEHGGSSTPDGSAAPTSSSPTSSSPPSAAPVAKSSASDAPSGSASAAQRGTDCQGCRVASIYKRKATGCRRYADPKMPPTTAAPMPKAGDDACDDSCCPGLIDCNGCARVGAECLDASKQFSCEASCCPAP